jgi:hypothetical protein
MSNSSSLSLQVLRHLSVRLRLYSLTMKSCLALLIEQILYKSHHYRKNALELE